MLENEKARLGFNCCSALAACIRLGFFESTNSNSRRKLSPRARCGEVVVDVVELRLA
jgi:hypothetical protein